MFKIPVQQAAKFLNETNKYVALSNLCNYLEDTCTKDERLEAVCIRKAVDAALALKYAMENDKESNATTYFSKQFTDLWEFIVRYCESYSAIKWVVEITEVLQKRVTIDAYSKEDALIIAHDMYGSGFIVLDAESHIETKFDIVEEQ